MKVYLYSPILAKGLYKNIGLGVSLKKEFK